MSRDIINLLPPDRLAQFRRDYFLRLATVVVLLLTLLVVIHGIFLLPSYLYLVAEDRFEENQYASLASTTDPTSDAAVARLSILKGEADYLARLGSVPEASRAIRTVLSLPRTGIHITNITYAPPSGATGNTTMQLAGVADTREALRTYDETLSSAAFISKVDLPISAYAKESSLPFTMTLMGTFTP